MSLPYSSLNLRYLQAFGAALGEQAAEAESLIFYFLNLTSSRGSQDKGDGRGGDRAWLSLLLENV
jgi:hypothetical protein